MKGLHVNSQRGVKQDKHYVKIQDTQISMRKNTMQGMAINRYRGTNEDRHYAMFEVTEELTKRDRNRRLHVKFQ